MTEEKDQLFKQCLTDFAFRSFRDVADQDYIVARMCFRDGLTSQFAWQSLQAIEKYLKGILLFNELTSIKYGHNVSKLASSIEQLKHLNFKIPKTCNSFLKYAYSQGLNRYNTVDSYCKGNELEQLDETISYIRRYCQPVINNSLQQEVRNHEASRHFELKGGYLERILLYPESPKAQSILWKNKFFDPDAEQVFGSNLSFEIPLLSLHPEHIERLIDFVQFSKPELKAYRSLAEQHSRKKK